MSPLAAGAVVGVMLSAIATVHWTKGFFNQDGGYEFPLLLGATALAVAFSSPGRYSVDRLIGWSLDGATWGALALVAGLVGSSLVLGERELRTRRVRRRRLPA